MSNNETNEVRKLKEAFDELITSVDVRRMSWNTELSLRNRIVECCDDSVSELYKSHRAEITNVQQAYTELGIAMGIELALRTAGIDTEHISEEIKHTKIGHNERVEQIRNEQKELIKLRQKKMDELSKKNMLDYVCGEEG